MSYSRALKIRKHYRFFIFPHFVWFKERKPIKDTLGLHYQTWSNYESVVSDPAGLADSAAVWYANKWFSISLELQRVEL